MEGVKTNNKTRIDAILMLVCAAALWSTGGFLIKLVDLSPLAIACIRSFIAAIVIMLFMGKPAFKFSFNKIAGAIAYASMVILFVSATKLTTAANAILLQYTSPIYIALFGGWLLKEKATLKDWITILFVIAGMLLFFMDDLDGGQLTGNLLGVLSGAALAFNTIFMRRQKDGNPLENVFWGCILTVIITLPFAFQKVPSVNSCIGLLLLGVFQLGLSYVLCCSAIKRIKALEATFISLVEPLLSPVWVMLFVGEIPGKYAIIGGIVVLTAVTISCIKPGTFKANRSTAPTEEDLM